MVKMPTATRDEDLALAYARALISEFTPVAASFSVNGKDVFADPDRLFPK